MIEAPRSRVKAGLGAFFLQWDTATPAAAALGAGLHGSEHAAGKDQLVDDSFAARDGGEPRRRICGVDGAGALRYFALHLGDSLESGCEPGIRAIDHGGALHDGCKVL